MLVLLKGEVAAIIAAKLQKYEGHRRDWEALLKEQFADLRLEARRIADGKIAVPIFSLIAELSRRFYEDTALTLSDFFREQEALVMKPSRTVVVSNS